MFTRSAEIALALAREQSDFGTCLGPDGQIVFSIMNPTCLCESGLFSREYY